MKETCSDILKTCPVPIIVIIHVVNVSYNRMFLYRGLFSDNHSRDLIYAAVSINGKKEYPLTLCPLCA
jgi:hypothetical protein